MGTLDFVAAIVNSLAWPLAAVVIALSFRKKLEALIDKVRRLSWGDKSVELADRLEAVEEKAGALLAPANLETTEIRRVYLGESFPLDDPEGKAASIRVPPPPNLPPRSSVSVPPPARVPSGIAATSLLDASVAERFDRLLEISPAAAVTEAWQSVLDALEEAGARLGYDSETLRATRRLVRRLEQDGALPRSAVSVILDLRGIRNIAAHEPKSVTRTDAARFFELATAAEAALVRHTHAPEANA